MKVWRFLCLVPISGEDQFICIKLSHGDVKLIEHCGLYFKKTSRKTVGGWSVFKQVIV